MIKLYVPRFNSIKVYDIFASVKEKKAFIKYCFSKHGWTTSYRVLGLSLFDLFSN